MYVRKGKDGNLTHPIALDLFLQSPECLVLLQLSLEVSDHIFVPEKKNKGGG